MLSIASVINSAITSLKPGYHCTVFSVKATFRNLCCNKAFCFCRIMLYMYIVTILLFWTLFQIASLKESILIFIFLLCFYLLSIKSACSCLCSSHISTDFTPFPQTFSSTQHCQNCLVTHVTTNNSSFHQHQSP